MMKLHRRSLLLAGWAATLVAVTPGARANTLAATNRKLVIIILRGAMDGMAALPKTDDPDIHAHRGALVDAKAIALSDGFALHSAMPASG